ncbi:hypothetical protein BG005_011334 [Podila minutissima]|nr:hypothetical protein BG005_011334 [Podila minutissima]
MPPFRSLRSTSRVEQARSAPRVRVLRSAGAPDLLKVVSPAKAPAKRARSLATKRANDNKLVPANRTKVMAIKQAITTKLASFKCEKVTVADPTVIIQPMPVKCGKGTVSAPMDMPNPASIKGGEVAVAGPAVMAYPASIKGREVAVAGPAVMAYPASIKGGEVAVAGPAVMAYPASIKGGEVAVTGPAAVMAYPASIKGGEVAVAGPAVMANPISVKGLESVVAELAVATKPISINALKESVSKINKDAAMGAIAVSAVKAIDALLNHKPPKPVKPKRTTMTIKKAKENLKNVIPEIKSTRHSQAPLYGKYWLRESTGATMLAHRVDLPKTGYRGIPTLVWKANVRSGDEIIAEDEHFEEWTRIPSCEHVDKALRLVAGDDNIFEFVRFGVEPYLYSHEKVMELSHIIHSRDYVENLHKMESWLVEDVMKRNCYLAENLLVPHHDLIPVQLWEQVESACPSLDDLGLMVLENYAVIHGVLEEYGAWFQGFDDLHPPDLIDPEDEAEYDRVSKEIEEDERARKAAKACQLLRGTVKEDRRSTAYDRPDPTEINNSSSKSPLSNAAKNESRNEYSDVEPPSMTRSAPIKASFLDLHSNLVAVPPPATSPASVANPPHVTCPTSVCPVITAKPVLHNAKTHCAQANCPEGVCIEDPQYEAKSEDSSRQA